MYHTTHKAGEYPKRKFAPSGGSVVVENATEEKALGVAWTDTDPDALMADFPEAAPATAKPAEKAKARQAVARPVKAAKAAKE